MNKDITLEDLYFKKIYEDEDEIIYKRDYEIIIFKILENQLNSVEFLNIHIIGCNLLQAIYNKCKEIGRLDE